MDILITLALVFMVWMCIDCMQRKEHFVWIIIMVVLFPVGAIAYYFTVKSKAGNSSSPSILQTVKNKNNIKDYPTHLSTTCKEVSKVDDSSKLHKTLLDIGESLLVYIVGIMFGEYKKSGKISEKLETGFYRFSSRPASFGVYLSFMRDMSKELEVRDKKWDSLYLTLTSDEFSNFLTNEHFK